MRHRDAERDIEVIDLSTSTVARHIGEVGVSVKFEAPSVETERLLVAKIFTHGYKNDGKAAQQDGVLGIWRRLAGPPVSRSAPA